MRKLAYIAIGTISASILILCAVFFFITNISEKTVRKADQILCEHIRDAALKKLNEPIIVSKMMASDGFLLNFLQNEGDLDSDTETMKSYLSRIQNNFGFAQATLISAKTYRYYRDDKMYKIINPTGYSHDLWFNLFEAGYKDFSVNVFRHIRGIDYSKMYVNYRIQNADGKFLGVASPSIYIKDVMAAFSELEEKYHVKINTTDSSGIVNIDSTFSEIMVANLSHLTGNKKENQFKKTGLTSFFASYYLPDFDWYFIIRSTDKTENNTRFLLFYLIAVSILSIDLFVLFMTTKILRSQNNVSIFSKEQLDKLTGLPNRNYFKDQFGERGLFNTTIYKCIAVFDIDYFKEANDNMNGDQALLSVVKKMSALLENHGVMLRWGGDEFVVLFELPLENAYKICRDFCKSIEENGLITVSIGLTAVNLSDSIKTNYHRAARYCYMVKELGGNGVKKD
ncbi:GGDEF domain-containing protein [uncultured Treponema sp.]|uniref:GGDEF domain-containing protein n=1 Tax=uncultured Treponema sp. TaxID=162155 RepID=UPI0025D65666|nr:GGDEF domain-containing protein [uncultured Treponema sp.]